MDDDTDQSLTGVGPRLRALRQQRDATLAELSATTGISVSTLSRLESGSRRPTLELLLPLARAHGVTLDELVDAPPTGDPRVHLRPVQHHGMTMVPLTAPRRRDPGLQAGAPGREGARAAARPADPRGLRVALRPRRPAAAGARRARRGARARRGGGVRHPGARTGSPRPTSARSSCSACSASRGSGPTCGRGRRAAASPAQGRTTASESRNLAAVVARHPVARPHPTAVAAVAGRRVAQDDVDGVGLRPG